MANIINNDHIIVLFMLRQQYNIHVLQHNQYMNSPKYNTSFSFNILVSFAYAPKNVPKTPSLV